MSTTSSCGSRVGRWCASGVFANFDTAPGFVEQISHEAVDYLRRPDMCIDEFNHVRVTIADLHNGDLTPAEHRPAAKLDAVIERHHPDAVPSW